MTLKGHTGPVHAVAFSPDGRQLASASDDGTMRLWDPSTGQATAPLGHDDWVRGVAFSPDGRLLASANGDGTVRLWDPSTGQLTETLTGHGGLVNGVAFSPDGRQLASAGNDRTVRLCDPSTGQLIATLDGHRDRVQAVAFSPDGRQLASGSSDHIRCGCGTPPPGKPTTTLGDHSRVYGVAFSPDGHLLASAGRAHTVRLWDPPAGSSSSPSKATPDTSMRWRSRRPTDTCCSPAPATTAPCGCGTLHRAAHRHPQRPQWPGAGGGVFARRPPARHWWQRPHGTVVGPVSPSFGRARAATWFQTRSSLQ